MHRLDVPNCLNVLAPTICTDFVKMAVNKDTGMTIALNEVNSLWCFLVKHDNNMIMSCEYFNLY